jgi:hypothetical protein
MAAGSDPYALLPSIHEAAWLALFLSLIGIYGVLNTSVKIGAIGRVQFRLLKRLR